jgi:hypothetical protein
MVLSGAAGGQSGHKVMVPPPSVQQVFRRMVPLALKNIAYPAARSPIPVCPMTRSGTPSPFTSATQAKDVDPAGSAVVTLLCANEVMEHPGEGPAVVCAAGGGITKNVVATAAAENEAPISHFASDNRSLIVFPVSEHELREGRMSHGPGQVSDSRASGQGQKRHGYSQNRCGTCFERVA